MGNAYKLKVTTPGKVIIYRNRPVRTPVEFILNKKELDMMLVQLDRLGTKDYRVETIEKVGEDLGFTDEEVKEILGEPIVEKKESNTLLDKLLEEN